jgi:hypothetical protein
MSKHPFRKAAGLTFLYGFIIIGIFILQFRNESVILRNIGLLRMSVAQTQDKDGVMSLKNTVSVSFKGISFTADDVHPATLAVHSSQAPQALTLLSWEQPTPQSFRFNFTHDTSITFAVSDTSSKASLTVSAQLPQYSKGLSLYYKPVSGYSVTEQSRTRQLFSSKNISYTMSATQISDTQIVLTRSGNVAMYTRYDPSKTFTFASIPADSETATASAYENTLKNYRTALVQGAVSAFTDGSALTENIVAAYMAEMSASGQYTQALETVPESFRKGSRRTYYTAPYFNTLVAMYPSLVMANDNFSSMVNNALAQKSLDIFSVNRIDEYLLRAQKTEAVQNLVKIPASIEKFNPTLSQATGILEVYMSFTKAGCPLAASMESVIEKCLGAVTNACSISSDNLVLQANETPVSFNQAVETGSALIDYGKYFAQPEYCSGGYMIINTAFAANQNLDLRTLADIYHVLIKNNPAYPHSFLVSTKNAESVWAWTCASNITYEENAAGTEASITVSFKQGDTHYIILNGIKPFNGIEIYGLSFHTDPRFETYNSSGYVYNEKNHTLFLKSRHKVSNEKIHLYFKPEVKTEPQTETARSETQKSENSTQPQVSAPAQAGSSAPAASDTSSSSAASASAAPARNPSAQAASPTEEKPSGSSSDDSDDE